MRIAIDVSPLLGTRAGVGTYVEQLVKALVRVGSQYEYILYAPGPIPSADARFFRDYPYVRMVQCPRFLLKSRTHWDRVDIFHGMNYKVWGWGRYGSVVTIHDLAVDRLSLPSRKLLGQHRSFVRGRRTARRASHVIAVSRYTAADIVDLYGVPTERITVITPAVRPEFSPVTDPVLVETVKAKYKIHGSGFLLCTGGAEPRKNVVTLIEAFRRVSQHSQALKLVVVGGMDRGAESIHDTVRRLGLDTAVIFPGHIPIEDLQVLYSSCDVFVFPSLYEGFGMPVLEAMACGAPIVSSNASSLPEVVGDVALLVDPTDIEGLALAMRQVVQDHSLREDLRRRGRLRANTFSWERGACDLLRVYRGLCTTG